jgi:hypothetical protein
MRGYAALATSARLYWIWDERGDERAGSDAVHSRHGTPGLLDGQQFRIRNGAVRRNELAASRSH